MKIRVSYLHPKMESLLKETCGVMIYQEDVIRVAHEIAGMSLGEADLLRRAMSGKERSPLAMDELERQFLTKASQSSGTGNRAGNLAANREFCRLCLLQSSQRFLCPALVSSRLSSERTTLPNSWPRSLPIREAFIPPWRISKNHAGWASHPVARHPELARWDIPPKTAMRFASD